MMKQLLSAVLDGLPPTVNHLYRTARNSRRYKTKAGKAWQEEAAAIFRMAYRQQEPYAGDVAVEVLFRTKDKRRWDLDNRLKALFDTLMMAGVVKDDSQIQSLGVSRRANRYLESATMIWVYKRD